MFSCSAQKEIKSYVQHNVVSISAIDPDSSDYSDLAAFGDAIGGSRVVMLGEQDHGDAATFLAKTRLIKYLHEKKGFNVLAFESDFFGLELGWERVVRREENFYRYVPATMSSSRPLVITGFDCQMTNRPVVKALDSVIRVLQLPVAGSGGYESEILPELDHWALHVKDSVLNNKYLAHLARIKQELKEKLPVGSFWLQLIDNLEAEDREYTTLGVFAEWTSHMNTRDRQMAANLKWLTETKYPKEKIIVWAHNYHISKFGDGNSDGYYNQMRPMGTMYTSEERLMAQTYVLGFTSYEGRTGRLYKGKEYKLPKPKADGFESWVCRDHPFAFVDFRKFNADNHGFNSDFYLAGGAKGNLYHTDMSARWNRFFDGVFFVRDMYPCKMVK
jgi:erythromycin esterase-like protein